MLRRGDRGDCCTTSVFAIRLWLLAAAVLLPAAIGAQPTQYALAQSPYQQPQVTATVTPTPRPVYPPAQVHYVNIGEDLAGDYKFGYDTGKNGAGQSFREEARLPDGTVKGAYGYIDADGKQRIVKYTAGIEGFKVESDEEAPGQSPGRPAAAPQARAYSPPQPQPEIRAYSPPAQTQPEIRTYTPAQLQPQIRTYTPAQLQPQPQPQPQSQSQSQPIIVRSISATASPQIIRSYQPATINGNAYSRGVSALGGYTPVQQYVPSSGPATTGTDTPTREVVETRLPPGLSQATIQALQAVYGQTTQGRSAVPQPPITATIVTAGGVAQRPQQLLAQPISHQLSPQLLSQLAPQPAAPRPVPRPATQAQLPPAGYALRQPTEPPESSTWGPPVINKELLSYNIGVQQG